MNRITEIEERLSVIKEEMMTDGANLDALNEECDNLIAERKALKDAEEVRQKELAEIANGKGELVMEPVLEMVEEKRTITVDSAEYRDAFYANLLGQATAEQRTTLINVDGTTAGTSGDAIAIPKTLDEKIWDNIHSAHPVLADITTVNSGVILEVTKHTAITAGKAKKKKDGDSNSDASVAVENNTFVKVQLVGKDFTKYVQLTYAEAKMSQGALESYLAEEIAADLGEALAKEVFTQMISDAGSNVVSKSTNGWFETIATGLGTADRAVKPVIYCTAANYYSIFGEVDTAGQPIFRNGVAIGAEVKIDSSVPSGALAIVVDPSKFVLNQIQGVMIEADKDIKEHNITISGYLRAEGCMRDNGAVAEITA